MANNRNRDASAQNLLDEKLSETVKKLREELSDLKSDSVKIMENLKKAFNQEYVNLYKESIIGVQKEILTLNENKYLGVQAEAKAYKAALEQVKVQKGLLESILFNTKNKLKLENEHIKYLIQNTSLTAKSFEVLKKEAKTKEEKVKLLAKQQIILRIINDYSKNSLEKAEKTLDNIEEQNEALHKQETQLEKITKVEERVAGIGSHVLKMFTGITGQVDTLGTATALWLHTTEQGSKKAIFDKIAADFQNKLTAANVSMQFVQKGEELVANSIRLNLDYYNNQQRMFQETGMQQKVYRDVINDTVSGLQNLSITSEEAMRAVKTLYTDMNMYSESGMKEELADNVAILERLGVQGSSTVKTMNELNKVYGQNEEQVINTTQEVTKFAKVLGISTNKAVSDLSSNMAHLAAYPARDVIKIFKELEITAKKTGLEMNALLGISEGFDTFEGASEKVGKLNTFLKGPFLNTMDLINANTPEERIRMLTDALNESGQSFQSMGRYGQIAFSEVLGKNVDETAKLFGNQINGINSVTNSLNGQADALGKVSDMAEDNSTTDQRIKTIQEQAAGITALNGIISDSISFLSKFGSTIANTMILLQIMGIATNMVGMAQMVANMRTSQNTVATVQNSAAKTQNSMAAQAEAAAAKQLWAIMEAETAGVKMNTVAQNENAAARRRVASSGGVGGIGKGLSGKGMIGAGIAGIAGMGIQAAGANGLFGEEGSAGSAISQIGGGVLQGVGMGAFFGVPGMVIGGLIGGGLGALGAFAEGTDSSPNGLAVVGEKGPELVSLPGNSSVINNSNTNKIVESFSNTNKTNVNNSGNKNITLNIKLMLDQDVLASHTKTITADYLENNMNIVIR